MANRPRLTALALLIAGPAAAQPRLAREEIGSWVLTCPTDTKSDCQLRHQAWILPPGAGHPAAALEVLRRADHFVPVLVIRGLSMQAALGGILAVQGTVSLRFDDAPPIDVPCGLDGAAVLCVPEGAQSASADSQLSGARSVQIQLQLSLPGLVALPEQARTLDLQRTAEALTHFRASAPAAGAAPAVPGLGWRGFLDRVLRDAGLEHGVADLLPTISGWSGDKRR